MLPITLTTAAAAALLNIWLAVRIVRVRIGNRIEFGDAGNRAMTARVRSHANFTEYTPFVLILMGLIEFGAGSRGWLWVIGIVYMIARVVHPFGMDRQAPNALRAVAMAATFGVLGVLAVAALALAYSTPLPLRF